MGRTIVEKIGDVTFSWDATKELTNFTKHRVTMRDGAAAYHDTWAYYRADPIHSDRGHYICLASSQVLFVVYAELVDTGDRESLRLISVRHATKQEAALYRRNRENPKATSPLQSGFLEFRRRHPPRGFHQDFPVHDPLRLRKDQTGLAFHIRNRERAWALGRAAQKPSPGERVAAMRAVHGWTQTDLAKRAGMQQSTLSHVENNQSPLGARRAERIATALGVTPAWVLWGAR